MQTPENIRKCVAFVGYQMANGEHRLAGSAFFVGKPIPDTDRANPVYLVTARHILDEIRGLGLAQIELRTNKTSGESEWVTIPIARWFTHPTDQSVDVAITPCVIEPAADHLAIPYSIFLSEQDMVTTQVGPGEEVIVVGLFRHHHGTRKNIPIVRVGNIASLGEEKVTTRLGDMDAYLIEARSIGGLSGSPVFVNFGHTRVVNGELRVIPKGPTVFLLGLIHGHFDTKASAVDGAGPSNLSVESVNTGIATVVPQKTIRDLIQLFETSVAAPYSRLHPT